MITSKNHIIKYFQSGLKEILITLHPAKNTSWTKSYAQKSIKRFAKKISYPLSDVELEKLKFSFMVNKLYIEVVCTNWDNNGNSRGGTMKHLIPEKIRVNPCEKPIREFVISYDGSVHLCCHSYQNKEIDNSMSKVDKLDDDSIFKIFLLKKKWNL